MYYCYSFKFKLTAIMLNGNVPTLTILNTKSDICFISLLELHIKTQT